MVFTYEKNNDELIKGGNLQFYAEISREYGLPGKEDAGKAKMEVGKSLLELILKEETLNRLNAGSNSSLLNDSSAWFDGHSCMRLSLGDFRLYIGLSADHHRKPKSDGTYSRLTVSIHPEEKDSRPIMQSDLVKRMIGYLDNYQFRPQPKVEGELVPEPAR